MEKQKGFRDFSVGTIVLMVIFGAIVFYGFDWVVNYSLHRWGGLT